MSHNMVPSAPFPPCMSREVLAMSRAFPQLLRLTIEIFSGGQLFSSSSLPTRKAAANLMLSLFACRRVLIGLIDLRLEVFQIDFGRGSIA